MKIFRTIHLSCAWSFLLCIALCSGDEPPRDAREGEDLTLPCRFPPHLASKEPKPLFIWMREIGRNIVNAAIGEIPLSQNYELIFQPLQGRYDLVITNVSFYQDNGKFVCLVQGAGNGEELFRKATQLVVLRPPGPPQISPAGPIATEGRQLDLACTSPGGSPDPIMRWYREGASSPLDADISPGRAVLHLTPRREDNQAVFRCVVWNRAMPEGDKLQASATLEVNYFPRVEVGPTKTLMVERDGTATLECRVDAKPEVKNIRWLHEKRVVGVKPILTLPRVVLHDAGTYTCSADNGLGQLGEDSLTLDVLHAPAVSVESRKEVEEGEGVEIRCSYSANPRPAVVEWLRPGRTDFRQLGEVLRLARVSADHAGTYICRVINIMSITGSTQKLERASNASMTLLVRHKPGQTRISPDRPVALEGNSVTLTCASSPPGWPTPQYRWWRDGSDSTETTGAKYTIQSATLTHEGAYHCQPTNDMGQGTVATVTLEVQQPPRLITKLQPQETRREGDGDVSATCTAQGKPRPAVKWLKDDEELSPGISNIDITTHEAAGRSSVSTIRSTLRFTKPLTPSDRGHYTCLFENAVRREKTTMLLRVQHKPRALHQNNKVAGDINQTANIVCKIQAYPKPEVQWSFGSSQSILRGDGGRYRVNTTILPDDIVISTLSVSNIVDSDYGDYWCQARNSLGTIREHLVLRHTGPPEEPTNLRAIAIGSNSVQLAWDAGFNGGLQDTKFIVRYSKVSNGQHQASNCYLSFGHGDSSGSEFDCQMNNPCNVTSLEQHITYLFKVQAYNHKGNSNFSPNVTATTKVASLPRPQHVVYEPPVGLVTVSLPNSCLPLIGIVEIADIDGRWKIARMTNLEVSQRWEVKLKEGALAENVDETSRVRVRLCLKANPDICGESMEAEVGPAAVREASGLTTPILIAIIVSCIVSALLVGLIFVYRCCRRNQKQVKKDYPVETSGVRPSIIAQQPPPPYYPSGMDNKGLERSMDLSLDDNGKSPPYTGYHGAPPPSGHPPPGSEWMNMGYMENSYSNSNNGGSVNSQDSLWQLKSGGVDPNMAPPNGSAYQYDPLTHGGYGGYDDYGPYPPQAEEYLNQRNANPVPYNAIHKPRRRGDHIDSPYHDVSGLPDPYMDPEGEENNKTQHISLSFDESLESGYSTPNSRNRRVIREIIV